MFSCFNEMFQGRKSDDESDSASNDRNVSPHPLADPVIYHEIRPLDHYERKWDTLHENHMLQILNPLIFRSTQKIPIEKFYLAGKIMMCKHQALRSCIRDKKTVDGRVDRIFYEFFPCEPDFGYYYQPWEKVVQYEQVVKFNAHDGPLWRIRLCLPEDQCVASDEEIAGEVEGFGDAFHPPLHLSTPASNIACHTPLPLDNREITMKRRDIEGKNASRCRSPPLSPEIPSMCSSTPYACSPGRESPLSNPSLSKEFCGRGEMLRRRNHSRLVEDPLSPTDTLPVPEDTVFSDGGEDIPDGAPLSSSQLSPGDSLSPSPRDLPLSPCPRDHSAIDPALTHSPKDPCASSNIMGSLNQNEHSLCVHNSSRPSFTYPRTYEVTDSEDVTKPYRYVMLGIFHHSIVDGVSRQEFWNEYIKILENLDWTINEHLLFNGITSFTPSCITMKALYSLQYIPYIGRFCTSVLKNVMVPFGNPYGYYIEPQLPSSMPCASKARTDIVPILIPKVLTKRILEKCKKRKVSVNSLLTSIAGSALLCTVSQLREWKKQHKSLSYAHYKKRVSPLYGDIILPKEVIMGEQWGEAGDVSRDSSNREYRDTHKGTELSSLTGSKDSSRENLSRASELKSATGEVIEDMMNKSIEGMIENLIHHKKSRDSLLSSKIFCFQAVSMRRWEKTKQLESPFLIYNKSQQYNRGERRWMCQSNTSNPISSPSLLSPPPTIFSPPVSLTSPPNSSTESGLLDVPRTPSLTSGDLKDPLKDEVLDRVVANAIEHAIEKAMDQAVVSGLDLESILPWGMPYNGNDLMKKEESKPQKERQNANESQTAKETRVKEIYDRIRAEEPVGNQTVAMKATDTEATKGNRETGVGKKQVPDEDMRSRGRLEREDVEDPGIAGEIDRELRSTGDHRLEGKHIWMEKDNSLMGRRKDMSIEGDTESVIEAERKKFTQLPIMKLYHENSSASTHVPFVLSEKNSLQHSYTSDYDYSSSGLDPSQRVLPEKELNSQVQTNTPSTHLPMSQTGSYMTRSHANPMVNTVTKDEKAEKRDRLLHIQSRATPKKASDGLVLQGSPAVPSIYFAEAPKKDPPFDLAGVVRRGRASSDMDSRKTLLVTPQAQKSISSCPSINPMGKKKQNIPPSKSPLIHHIEGDMASPADLLFTKTISAAERMNVWDNIKKMNRVNRALTDDSLYNLSDSSNIRDDSSGWVEPSIGVSNYCMTEYPCSDDRDSSLGSYAVLSPLLFDVSNVYYGGDLTTIQEEIWRSTNQVLLETKKQVEVDDNGLSASWSWQIITEYMNYLASVNSLNEIRALVCETPRPSCFLMSNTGLWKNPHAPANLLSGKSGLTVETALDKRVSNNKNLSPTEESMNITPTLGAPMGGRALNCLRKKSLPSDAIEAQTKKEIAQQETKGESYKAALGENNVELQKDDSRNTASGLADPLPPAVEGDTWSLFSDNEDRLKDMIDFEIPELPYPHYENGIHKLKEKMNLFDSTSIDIDTSWSFVTQHESGNSIFAHNIVTIDGRINWSLQFHTQQCNRNIAVTYAENIIHLLHIITQ